MVYGGGAGHRFSTQLGSYRRSLDAIDRRDVEAFVAAKRAEAKAPKSIRNYLGVLHSIFALGEREGWCRGNPVKQADKPAAAGPNPDIRTLDEAELEALLRATTDDDLGHTDRVFFLVAAMTGLRMGEALALRWRDVDWTAGVIRVRRSYTRGEFGTPKSRRSSRAVPMADRVATDLERHFQRSLHQRDDDLVLGHPAHGAVLDGSAVRRRFKAAIRRAGVRDARLHDLRHSFATRMAAAGAPLRAIQEWMGHRDHKTTELYADYAPDPTNGAIWARRAFERADVGASGVVFRDPVRREPRS